MVISLKYYRFSQCKQTICPSLLRDDEPCSETGDGPCPGEVFVFATYHCPVHDAPLFLQRVYSGGSSSSCSARMPRDLHPRAARVQPDAPHQASDTMPIGQFYGWSIRKQSCERSGSDPD